MTRPLIIGATEGEARVACVLVHGRGQSPEAMVGLAEAAAGDARCRFVLPRAAGGAWYRARAVDPMNAGTEAELNAALDVVGEAMATARAAGVPVLLAGFSQGACLVSEYLMRRETPDAACLLTGCRVGRAAEGAPNRSLDGLPVYASCGDADPWVPLPDFMEMAGDLAAAGARLRTDIFPGRPHEVNGTEVSVLAGMLNDLAAGGTPGLEGR